MATYNLTKLRTIKLFQEKQITLFTSTDLVKIFGKQNPNTLKDLLRRLKQEGIIEQLTKGKYLFLHAQKEVSDFEIANFLVVPSYISLESALSLHGILEQFLYQVTSITIRESCKFKVHGKIFVYSRIKKEYFKDFIKDERFLIAPPKKALFDYLYFAYKGVKSQSRIEDFDEYLKKDTVKAYIFENADQRFLSFVKKHAQL